MENKFGRKSNWFIGEFPIAANRIEDHDPIWLHDHLFNEMIFIESGAASHVVDNTITKIQKGDIIIIPPGINHRFETTEGMTITNVMFDPLEHWYPVFDLKNNSNYKKIFDVVILKESVSKHAHINYLKENEFKDLLNLAQKIESVYTKKSVGYQSTCFFLFSKLISQILNVNVEEKKDPFFLIIEYIENKYNTDIQIEDLCESLKISPSTLHRKFKAALNVSPMEYVIQIRISHACQIMLNTKESIGDIAKSVGFHDPNYFSRYFKKHMGESPRDWRRLDHEIY